ncbi:hypothetical protein Acsp03_68620 [Actinomadura sp. NBRC 104412]|uniref:DUF6199 family natural product biosynthesis protein n=1 Tax=Actinomadura sp. NBRC 104412 TaxID=3032203 RepID=UPI0024A18066|nr:DUF6199 family natural product biosynthesis protein [Actinomadura sp. NBRC 104412]GLZ09396.1 hypothetical protein Acsp03_68620 [Actinomadura sp. NBRC 104412]
MWGEVLFFTALLVVLVTLCLLNVLFPRRMWGLFKSWRFKNPEVVEPSELVVWWYRISGALGMILLIGLGVYGVPRYYAVARCEKVLAELENVAETGGASAVERRARELGLDVRDGPALSGRLTITDDGEPFASVPANGSKGYCEV